MSRKIFAAILFMAVVGLGVLVVSAQDDTVQVNTDSYGTISIIADGRLNGTDLAAPVAVYPIYQNDVDADGNPIQSLTGLQLLQIDPATNNGEPLFNLSTDDVQQLMTSPSHSLTAEGFTLNYSPDTNWFWVAAPADAEGKVYTFQWANPGFPLVTTLSMSNQSRANLSTNATTSAAPSAMETPAP